MMQIYYPPNFILNISPPQVMLNCDVNEEFLAKFRDDDLTAFQKARKAVKVALRTQYS